MVARLSILAAAVLFGTTGTAQALSHVHAPLGVGAARIAVGGTLLAAAAAGTGGFTGLRHHLGAVLAAGGGVAVYQTAFFAALAATGVTIGTVVAIGAAPVLTGALEWAVVRRRPGLRWVAATVPAALGVAVLGLGAGGSTVAPAGVALALLASFGYAVYAVLGKRLLDAGARPMGVMGATFGVGAVLLAPVAATAGRAALAEPRGLLLVVYLGLVPTALAYVLFARALRELPASETATFGLAEPLTAAVLAFAVLGERPGVVPLLGAGLILLALGVLAAPRRDVLEPVPVPS